MDGNGRWAKARHRPRSFGHQAGVKTVRNTVEMCLRAGISTLTLFAFSSENWKRPETEVSALMELFVRAMDSEVDRLDEHQVRLQFIGDLNAFAPALRNRMLAAMTRTAKNQKLTLNVAINYGGRWDIVNACKRLASAVSLGDLHIDDITAEKFQQALVTQDEPEPDLFIRTGGDFRISNFLLWQLAYSELIFLDTLWPDFAPKHMAQAINNFAQRERRFGQTSEQIQTAT